MLQYGQHIWKPQENAGKGLQAPNTRYKETMREQDAFWQVLCPNISTHSGTWRVPVPARTTYLHGTYCSRKIPKQDGF